MGSPATPLFQSIASSQTNPPTGPFSQFLDPTKLPIDEPQPPASGYETGPVGAGRVALEFLKSVRARRVADFVDKEHQAQESQNMYEGFANRTIQDPDLNDAGVNFLSEHVSNKLADHFHHQTKDVQKGGAMEAVKNVFSQMLGGPRSVREPIDFHAGVGEIHQIRQQHPEFSQKYVYSEAIKEGQQAVEALRQKNLQAGLPPPNAAEVRQATSAASQKVVIGAPKYSQVFWQSMGVSPGAVYPEPGSFEAEQQKINSQINQPPTQQTVPMNQSPLAQQTAPPPLPPQGNLFTPELPVSPGGIPSMLKRPPEQAATTPATPAPPVAAAPAQPGVSPAAPAQSTGPKPGDFATVNGKRVQIKSINNGVVEF